MSRRGTLTKVGRTTDIDNPHAFRTDAMDGEFEIVPRVNGYFAMRGESLTPGMSMRLMTTSLIKSVEEPEVMPDGKYRVAFETQNSLYVLEYMP